MCGSTDVWLGLSSWVLSVINLRVVTLLQNCCDELAKSLRSGYWWLVGDSEAPFLGRTWWRDTKLEWHDVSWQWLLSKRSKTKAHLLHSSNKNWIFQRNVTRIENLRLKLVKRFWISIFFAIYRITKWFYKGISSVICDIFHFFFVLVNFFVCYVWI